MKLATRSFPAGALAYTNIDPVTKMQAKLFEKNPFLAFLPNIKENDSAITRTLGNIPGIKIKGKQIILKTGTDEYKKMISKLDKAFVGDSKNIDEFAIESPFMEKFLQLIKKFKSPNAYVNLLGPFSLSQMLTFAAEEQILADKSYRKLFIQLICVKALWAIKSIKEISPETVPIIVLEEPLLGQFGNIKRENDDVTVELVTNLLTRVIEKIKSAGAIVAIESMEKCDWKIPINAGVDIISFDAYNNPNNLSIIPETIVEFISRGGKINWAIVPVMTETIVKDLHVDIVEKRLFATMDGLILSGVPADFVYKSSLVSIQGNVDKLPVIFAEKAVMVATQLANRISVKI